MRLVFASSIVAVLLTAGAVVAFAIVRNRVATAGEVTVLGGIAAIPVWLLGAYSMLFVGLVGGAAIVVLGSCVIAMLGGGALRPVQAHG